MLHIVRFNSAFPGASRAALKGFTGALNFMIMPLLQRFIREERQGKPVDESVQNMDGVTDQTGQADEAELARQAAEDNGHAVVDQPLVTAGQLKRIYDWCADELLSHARLLEQKDGSKAADPFHLATDMRNSIDFRSNAPVKLGDAQLRAIREKCAMYGKSEAEAIESALGTAQRIQLAQRRDAERLYQVYEELQCHGEDGHQLEAESAFDRLHPVYQERVLAALDKALLGAFNRAADDDMRPKPRPDAAGDAAHLNGMRWEVRKYFQGLLKVERFARLRSESEQSATWAPEPLKVIEKQKKAA